MDSDLDLIFTGFKVVISIVAFVALMQLFPICIRLGQIRDKLLERENTEESEELAEATADVTGDPPA